MKSPGFFVILNVSWEFSEKKTHKIRSTHTAHNLLVTTSSNILFGGEICACHIWDNTHANTHFINLTSLLWICFVHACPFETIPSCMGFLQFYYVITMYCHSMTCPVAILYPTGVPSPFMIMAHKNLEDYTNTIQHNASPQSPWYMSRRHFLNYTTTLCTILMSSLILCPIGVLETATGLYHHRQCATILSVLSCQRHKQDCANTAISSCPIQSLRSPGETCIWLYHLSVKYNHVLLRPIAALGKPKGLYLSNLIDDRKGTNKF